MEGIDKEEKKAKELFLRLIEIVSILRSDKGCPWDRRQTERDVEKFLLEEVYELVDAIEKEDVEEIKEEIGDVILLCVFLARICEEKGLFDIGDSLAEVVDKLIRRHPHVFGDEKIDDPDDVIKNWTKIKEKEKKEKGKKDGIWSSVPLASPSLFQMAVLFDEFKKRGREISINESEVREKFGFIGDCEDIPVDILCEIIFLAGFLLYKGGKDPEITFRNYLRDRFGFLK